MTVYVDINQAEQAAQILVNIVEKSVDITGETMANTGSPGQFMMGENASREIWEWYKGLEKDKEQ